MTEEKEGKGFVIRDRRLFDESGEPKEEEAPREAAASSPKEPADSPGAAPGRKVPREEPDAEPPREGETAYPEVTFSGFVVSLSTTVLYHFGDIPDPVTNRTEKNLPAAKQTIDILGLLQQKTAGNLDEGEKALLESALFELRMRYVKESENR